MPIFNDGDPSYVNICLDLRTVLNKKKQNYHTMRVRQCIEDLCLNPGRNNPPIGTGLRSEIGAMRHRHISHCHDDDYNTNHISSASSDGATTSLYVAECFYGRFNALFSGVHQLSECPVLVNHPVFKGYHLKAVKKLVRQAF